MSESLIQSQEKIDDGVLVKVGGDIDFSRSPELRVALMQVLDPPQSRLVIDLQDVPYMDSSGVAVLVETLQKQRNAKGKLVLCNLTNKVKSIFEISRLDAVFTIVEDVDKAKAV